MFIVHVYNNYQSENYSYLLSKILTFLTYCFFFSTLSFCLSLKVFFSFFYECLLFTVCMKFCCHLIILMLLQIPKMTTSSSCLISRITKPQKRYLFGVEMICMFRSVLLSKDSLHSCGQLFHQYQQYERPSRLTSIIEHKTNTTYVVGHPGLAYRQAT